jgi:ribonuclease T2
VKAARIVLAKLAGALSAAVLSAAAWAYPHDGAQASPFDYYILSLSWSPSYCADHPADWAECRLGRGFVAHGLWPQYANGGGPEHCGSGETLDAETVDRALSAMPDAHLVRHEWVVHGTCSGLSAHDYFLSMIRAVGALSIPSDFDGEKTRTLTADQIAGQFLRANPALGPRSIVIRCKGEQFEELRICLSPDLHPVACGRGVHTQCRRTQSLRIRSAR